MLILTNLTEQTLAPGQSVTFDQVVLKSGCGEFWRQDINMARLRGNGQYNIDFSGNIGGTVAATPVQLQLQFEGAPLLGTVMISTPAAVGDLNNVSVGTGIKTFPCDSGRITVTNTGTSTVVLGAGSNLKIERVG